MNDRTRIIKDALWVLALFGLVAGVFRMWFGLGATTNLSDAMPWGLWKILNMVGGVALATSGFTVGLLVYVLRIKQFRPMMKPAIMVAFLGYGCSMLALLFDIGLPHRFWHPIVMWNEHSFLFEVFWCVLLYFTVTGIEMLPAVMERLRAHRIAKFIHGIAIGVVIFGISLSSLHHSSLGSLFLVTPTRLHELWYTSWLPIFFIMSAMGGGIMMLVLLRILYARWYDPEPVFGPTAAPGAACSIDLRGTSRNLPPLPGKDMPMLTRLASIAGGILGLYLLLKIVDLFRQDAWSALLAGSWESWLYGFELVITVVVPLVLLAIPRARRSPAGIGIAAFSAACGLALNRLDVGIFGYFQDAGAVYFPSLAEWAVGVGVIAAAGLAFFFLAENLSIFDNRWERLPSTSLFTDTFDHWSKVWHTALMDGLHRVTLLAVFAVPVAWILFYPPFDGVGDQLNTIEASVGVDAVRDTLMIDGDRQGVVAVFAHAEHQKRLGGDSSCVCCHHISMPEDRSTPCSRCHRDMVLASHLFEHSVHTVAVAEDRQFGGIYPSNQSCTECHADGQPEMAATAKRCYDCHREDMWLAGRPDSTADLAVACSFRDAMHGTCIGCHKERREVLAKPELAECSTCHRSLKARLPESQMLADAR